MQGKQLSRSDTLFMAACSGLVVANIYYCQPLLVLIAKDFNIPESRAGRIAWLTQTGYACGLLLLVPLGDIMERRKQILLCMVATTGSLALSAWSPTFGVLQVAAFLVGASSISAQLILPLAAHLAPDNRRGSVIGTIMGGIIVGILASRSVSGSLGAVFGWREIYYIAAGIAAVLLVLMRWRFPQSYPSFKGSYGQLMASILYYIRTQPALRQASFRNFMSFAALSSFWVTMVLFLSAPPFGYQSATIGLFGLAGAASALASPLVGKRSDGQGARMNIWIGLVMELLSFAAFYFTGSSLFLLVLGIILVDVGHQTIQISNQTIIYSILPEARNRFNTVFMTSTFIGGACGSAIGIGLWNIGHWPLFCAGTALMVLINVIVTATVSAKP
ncbi:MFS transporter [Chitinophaga japonensis]|uniref:Putative MFS family arabinose efflux permease n=1 Tax=Chitinophaga japonensis TaxID=104662 RepID=A0A562TE70_CHIJA|nr:MFS transporter [Chitinophaga japonensis]TWI91554.1 putative MFS family arabinose efflux permease [Chitinophaga japonensis]